MGYTLAMQVRQPLQYLPGNALDAPRTKLILLIPYQVPQITIHQIQTQVDNGGPMGPNPLIHHIQNIEDIFMLEMLKEFYFTECCDWEPVGFALLVLFLLEVLHLL